MSDPKKDSDKLVHQSVQEEVKKRLVEENNEVRDSVVTHMVNDEKKKRVELLEKAYQETVKLEVDLKRIKPDATFIVGDKEVSGYTPEQNATRKKLSERLQRLTDALDKAIKNYDWEPLRSSLQSGGNSEGPKSGDQKT